MIQDAFWGILIPFLGTSLGAGCVFFLKKSLSDGIQRALTGFAAGVMVAASVWSLLIPAMEQAADLYQKQLQDQIQKMIAVLEPTLVGILCVIVGIILLSVMLPLVGIMAGIG